jgi:hypothetical protein
VFPDFIMTTKAILFTLTGALAAGALSTAFAQEPAAQAPLPDKKEVAQEIKDAAALIPDEAPAVKDAANMALENLDKAAAKAQEQLEKFNSATLAAQQRIDLREARSKISQTEEMQTLKANIAAGTSDEARRQARIEYYNTLYDRLAKAVPGAKDAIEAQRKTDIFRQEFVRIRSHEEVAAGM